MLILSTLVKRPQPFGECRNPLQEVEQNSRPDRDSGVNPVLKQTNKQLHAKPTVKFTVKAGENNPRKKPVVKKRSVAGRYSNARILCIACNRKHVVAYECQNLPTFL